MIHILSVNYHLNIFIVYYMYCATSFMIYFGTISRGSSAKELSLAILGQTRQSRAVFPELSQSAGSLA